jgi:hypothetical protein
MNIRKRAGLVGLTVFGLPWAAVGVLALHSIPASLRDNKWDEVLGESAAGGFTGWIGFGILSAVAIQWKGMAAMDRSRGANPDKQWLWRPDWAAGRSEDLTHRKIWLLWSLAVLWTGLFAPLLYFLPKNVAATNNYPALLLLILPVASLGWIYGAVRFSRRWRKFGQSSFEMASQPFSIGGQVAGAIEFQKPFPTDAKFHLELTCTRHFKRKGSNGKTYNEEEDLWSDESTAQLDARGMVPVAFQLPANARETDIRESEKGITWQLDVKAPVKGTPYKASFDVPVFKVGLKK